MKKLTSFIIAIVLILFFNSCMFISKPDPNNVSIEILSAGKSNSKLLYTEKDNRMPSGEKATTDYNLNITEVTDSIKLYPGSQFGVEYIIKSPSKKKITLKTVWTYPQTMITEKGRTFDKIEYEIDKLTNEYTYSSYLIEESYEMIPGDWNLKLYYENKMLLDKTFVLLN